MPAVLHVLEALETGCARYVTDVVTYATGAQHEVVVPVERHGGVTDRDAVPAMRAAGAMVHTVAMRRDPWHPDNLRAVRTVRQLIRSRRPDVVHGHSSIGGVIARLAAARTGTPVVYTPNAAAEGALATAVERALRRLTATTVAVSPSERDALIKRGIVTSDKVVVIPNGVSPDTPTPRSLREVIGVDDSVRLVGTMGRVSHQKDTASFVAAGAAIVQRHADVELVLIGDGPDRAAVERQALAAGLDAKLHWLGELPGAAAYLHDLAVFVLPSRFEGLPFAALEAMRSGVPVVLSDAVGNRDVVDHQQSGLLVPIGDVGGFVAAVDGLLDDPARAAVLGAAGREHVVVQFTLQAMAAALDRVYAHLAGANGVL